MPARHWNHDAALPRKRLPRCAALTAGMHCCRSHQPGSPAGAQRVERATTITSNRPALQLQARKISSRSGSSSGVTQQDASVYNASLTPPTHSPAAVGPAACPAHSGAALLV
jgi:hypothetical protein